MTALFELTAEEMVASVRRGDVSRRELVQAHLDRIEAVNGPVNAIVELRADEALAEAEAADDSSAELERPLDGVPVTIKDHFDVEGTKHTEGVRSMADRVSPGDALAVSRLRGAGAIVVGKTNQPDFQIRWNTVNDLWGVTRNPRDLGLSAGGSSGGDAAAVASGMAAAGLGVDYGGSIRVPSSFCEIWGLRPSAGRVPDVPTLPPFDGPPTVDLMSSVGPMGRSVADLEMFFGVLTGPDARDPGTVDGPIRSPDAAAPCRVAVTIRETGASVEAEVEAAVLRTADLLADAGYEIVKAGFPMADRAPEVWAELLGTELMRVAMPGWDGLIADSNRQHIETMFGLFELGPDVARYIAAFAERRALTRETATWMDDHPIVLAPINGMPTPPLDFDQWLSVEGTRDLFDHMRNVMWVNLMSLPSIALPTGVQLVGRRFREDELFRAARVIEASLGPVSVATPASPPT